MVSKAMLSQRTLLNLMNLRCCQCLKLNPIIFTTKTTTCVSTQRYCSNAALAEEPNKQNDDIDEEKLHNLRDLRDVSRLPKRLHDQMSHRLIPPKPCDREHNRWKFFEREKFINHQRKLYAKYGHESGVDPGLMWPSKEELAEMVAVENEYEPSLDKLWFKMRSKQEKRRKALDKREAVINDNMAKMPHLFEQYRAKMQKREKERDMITDKRRRLMEDARNHFGYDMPATDVRYTEWKTKRYEVERLKMRQDKKSKREEKVVKIQEFHDRRAVEEEKKILDKKQLDQVM